MNYSIAVAEYAPDGYPAVYKKDLYEGIQKARDFGYAGIEWHLRRPDFGNIEKVKKHCDDKNLLITSIGTGMGFVIDGLTLMHADMGVRMQAVVRLKEFIDMGGMLNSKVIIGSMKGKISAAVESEKYEAYLKENITAVMEYAEKKNVQVVLEVVNRYETNLLSTVDQMNAFVRNLGSKLLKTHIDTFHMNIEEADMAVSIENCRDTLGHVHIADSNRLSPGAGHIDFSAILKALKKIDYKDALALECLPYPDPDATAKNAIDYLSAIKI